MSTIETTRDAERVINPGAGMDAVTLRVGDLENMASYYGAAFGMDPIAEHSHGHEVDRVLGRGLVPLVRLVHTPGLPSANRRQPGLYHTAFLFDTPASLAATVYRAASDPRSRFVGSADHLVSEAFYFTDPEGNGVELYTDRPRSSWVHDRGQIMMTTDYLDPNAYLGKHLNLDQLDTGSDAAAKVGHLHLQVGDLKTAGDFYLGAIGLEATLTEFPGALFTSAGGYHHHLAMNTWHSANAGPRAASLGLGEVAISVPHRDDLDALVARLQTKRLQFADDGRSVTVKDPWDTQVRVSAPMH
jgi:catechol 2,3-dioxygenase